MSKDDFHIPFLHGMIVVAVVTVVSMVFADFFIRYSYISLQKTGSFTSQEFQSQSKHTD